MGGSPTARSVRCRWWCGGTTAHSAPDDVRAAAARRAEPCRRSARFGSRATGSSTRRCGRFRSTSTPTLATEAGGIAASPGRCLATPGWEANGAQPGSVRSDEAPKPMSPYWAGERLGWPQRGRRDGEELRPTIVSDGPLGGDCTFTGCVPSKTVIEAARAGASFEEAFARARQGPSRDRKHRKRRRSFVGEGVEVVEGEGVAPVRRRLADVALPSRSRARSCRCEGCRARAWEPARVAARSMGSPTLIPLTSENVWDLAEMHRPRWR